MLYKYKLLLSLSVLYLRKLRPREGKWPTPDVTWLAASKVSKNQVFWVPLLPLYHVAQWVSKKEGPNVIELGDWQEAKWIANFEWNKQNQDSPIMVEAV